MLAPRALRGAQSASRAGPGPSTSMRRRAFACLCTAAALPLPWPGIVSASEVPVPLPRWQALVGQAAKADAAARIELVNAVLNRWLVEFDASDRLEWPTPREVLARGGGDCRAFAILKFFTLLAAGHAAPDTRVLYTILRRGDTPGLQRPHLVAWARSAGAEPRLLDNLNPFALPLSRRPDLRPVFSVDLEHLRRGADETIDRPAATLRPWREMLARRAAEQAQSLVEISSTRPLRGLTSQR